MIASMVAEIGMVPRYVDTGGDPPAIQWGNIDNPLLHCHGLGLVQLVAPLPIAYSYIMQLCPLTALTVINGIINPTTEVI